MSTNAPDSSTFRLTDTIRFLEIPTITLKQSAPDGFSDDDTRAPFTCSPLDEYRGAGSLSLRRIRTLGAPDSTAQAHDPTYAACRARSILREAREAIQRILGEGHPIADELERLLLSL